MDTSAKILLLGQPKAGKTTFINYFLGKDVAKPGTGNPITHELTAYERNDGRYPVVFYDAKGLEAEEANEQIEELVDFIKEKSGSDNIFGWFHAVFYCVSMANGRFQDFEAAYINDLKRVLGQHIHIIITHCDSAAKHSIKRMRERIVSLLDDAENVDFFEVVSVNKKILGHTVVQRRGKDLISERVFDLLWEDIANKVSLNYARTLTNAAQHAAHQTREKFENVVDALISVKELIKAIKDDDAADMGMDTLFDDLDQTWDEAQELVDRELNQALEPIAQLHESYWGFVTNSFVNTAKMTFGNALIWANISEPLAKFGDEDHLVSIILPKLYEAGVIDRNLDFTDMENAPLSKRLSVIVRGAKDILLLKKNLKNAGRSFFDGLIRAIPSDIELQQKAYDQLLAFKEDYMHVVQHRK